MAGDLYDYRPGGPYVLGYQDGSEDALAVVMAVLDARLEELKSALASSLSPESFDLIDQLVEVGEEIKEGWENR